MNIRQYYQEEREQWMRPLNICGREFVEISRSAYLSDIRPQWLQDHQPPWFFNANCDERTILTSAGLMYRAGDYVLIPSLLWLCQIELDNIPLEECIRKTEGFRFNLWYGRSHPDFESLTILPGSPCPTTGSVNLSTVSDHGVLPETSSAKPMCTFMDLDRDKIDHLVMVEQHVRQWLLTVGHWASSASIQSFFHIPPPDSPKNTVHLHVVAGKELELEQNHVFYRVPLSTLQHGKQPSFIVDLTRWRMENRNGLVDLANNLAQTPFVYGIAGCTSSGKSKLAVALGKEYDTELVHQDDFLLPDEQLPTLSETELSSLPSRWVHKKNIDRSHPDAIDWKKLIDRIKNLKRNTSKLFILLEGNLILSQQAVRDILDRILFIDVPESKTEIIMRRRMARIRPGCLSEVQMGVTEVEYLPYFNSVWRKYHLYGQSCFQAHHLDCEVSTEDAISQLHPWFVDHVGYELSLCRNQFKSACDA